MATNGRVPHKSASAPLLAHEIVLAVFPIRKLSGNLRFAILAVLVAAWWSMVGPWATHMAIFVVAWVVAVFVSWVVGVFVSRAKPTLAPNSSI